MKYVTTLVDKQLITVEHTSYMDDKGMKWNGNNQYTILPIQMAMDHCYQQQMLRLEEQQKRDQAQKRLRCNAENAPCTLL